MATATKITPPFAWLGKYIVAGSFAGTLAVAAAFRFYQLSSLPPGLYAGPAQTGLQALNLVERGWLPGLNAANGYAPLWVWLQAIAIKLFGHTQLALLLWPALLGTLAVITTWLWIRSWFGLRLAWLSSFLLAVTPWGVTLSRIGIEAAIFPLLVSLTLWTGTIAWRKHSLTNGLAFGVTLALDLAAGPVGWLLALAVAVTGLIQLSHKKALFAFDRARLAAGLIFLGSLAGLSYHIGASFPAIKDLPGVAGFTTSLSAVGTTIVRTLLMFNVHGDDNYRHNLAGEPLLNAFVGLMLVTGLLVAISRLHELRYRLLLSFTIIMLLPAFLTTTGAPNAARAYSAAPLILTLCAVGISYMLELWYRTFPINSAARATGQSAIIALLALTLFQGYTQYFKAWAGTSQVYAAYNEGAVLLSSHLIQDGKGKPFTGTRFVVAATDEQPVVSYLVHNDVKYTALTADQINSLPISPGTRRFWITAVDRDQAIKSFKLKFPGGTLVPHYSQLDQQTEIYYTYEATK